MSIAIAVFNQKGGAGKTPVTINLAGALAALGKRVLVCDLGRPSRAHHFRRLRERCV